MITMKPFGVILSGIVSLFLTIPQQSSGRPDFLSQNRTNIDTEDVSNSSKVIREAPITVVNPDQGYYYGGSEFGEECETNGKECNYSKFLECIDGKCVCQNPLHRAFDDDLKQCVSLSGSGCGTGPSCVKNSQCSYGTCQCLQDHSATTTKICLLNKGQPCKSNECNGEKGLACIRGTCQCMDSFMITHPFTGNCIIPQVEFNRIARQVAERVVVGKISRTVNGAKSLATNIALLPVRSIAPGITSIALLPIRLLVPGIG